MLKGDRLAIVVGINEYKDPNIPKLPGAEYDAKEIYERLQDPNIGNFKMQSYLVGQGATCKEIRKAINDAFWKTDSHDLVLFYFSGHGFVDGYNEGYIAPYDMLLDEPFTCGINMRELRETISKSINKKSVVVILDCCYSGIATKGDRSPLLQVTKENFETHLKIAGENRIILASSQSDQKSREIEVSHTANGERHLHGSFTFHLLEGIDGGAYNEKTGKITLDRLYRHIEKKMLETNPQQNPIFSVTEARQLENIEIALVKNIWLNNKEAIEKDIVEAASIDDVKTLNHAAKQINALRTLDPDNARIEDFKEAITHSLKRYDGKIISWLEDDNNNDIRVSIAKISSQLWGSLSNFESRLNFDALVKMDAVDLNRLSALFDIINGIITPDIFVKRLTPKSSPGSRVSYSGGG
jgi:Caspase domain